MIKLLIPSFYIFKYDGRVKSPISALRRIPAAQKKATRTDTGLFSCVSLRGFCVLFCICACPGPAQMMLFLKNSFMEMLLISDCFKEICIVKSSRYCQDKSLQGATAK
jgi:hypothetical protein